MSIANFNRLFEEIGKPPQLTDLQSNLMINTVITPGAGMSQLTGDRFRTDWYHKKANQNRAFSKMLLAVIRKHADAKFPYDVKTLRDLPYSDLAEIAVATVNKKLHIVLGKGMDLSDKSDVKCVVSQYRNNVKEDRYGNANWMHSYAVTNIKDKECALRVVAFNEITKKFEFFFIPYADYSRNMARLEIIIERKSMRQGESPEFTGSYADSGIYCKWFEYQCDSFEDMALRN